VSGARAIARGLLAEAAGAGASITAEGGRLLVGPAGRVSPGLLARLRAHRADLLALLAPGVQAAPADPRRSPLVSQALAAFAEWGPIQTIPARADAWSRSEAARRLRWARRGREQARARRMRQAWRLGLAAAVARGLPPARAAAAALDKLDAEERCCRSVGRGSGG